MPEFKQQPHTGFFHARKQNELAYLWEGSFNTTNEELEKSKCTRMYVNFKTRVISAWSQKEDTPIGSPEMFVCVNEDVEFNEDGTLNLKDVYMGQYTQPIIRSNSFAMFLQVNTNNTVSLFVVEDKPQNMEATLDEHANTATAFAG